MLSAGRKSSPQSERALGELCQTYWYPLYAYVRRQGSTKEDAEDRVQAFFKKFLEKNYLEGLNAERGRFRAFLLASLKHFLANEWHKSQRQKRGGGALHLSLDWQSADERFHLDPPDPSSPDKSYDREWALALLERVIVRLRDECTAEDKATLFEQAVIAEHDMRTVDASFRAQLLLQPRQRHEHREDIALRRLQRELAERGAIQDPLDGEADALARDIATAL